MKSQGKSWDEILAEPPPSPALSQFLQQQEANVAAAIMGRASSARCPTCGRSVPTIFEHIDVDCHLWPDRGDDPGNN